jgi:hypothetical protein
MKRTPRPPKSIDLSPIYNMNFKSSTKLTEMGLKHELVDRNKKKQQCFSGYEEGIFVPHYVQLKMLIKMIGSLGEEAEKFAGYQLLRYRSNKAIQSNNIDLTIVAKEAENSWKKLCQLASARSSNWKLSRNTCKKAKCPPLGKQQTRSSMNRVRLPSISARLYTSKTMPTPLSQQ